MTPLGLFFFGFVVGAIVFYAWLSCGLPVPMIERDYEDCEKPE